MNLGYEKEGKMKIKLPKRLVLLILILTSFFLLWLLITWVINGGWPANTASGEKLPIHIMKVQPLDGELVKSPSSFCVNFDFRAGNGMGENPTKDTHFFYDGVDVSRQTDGLITLDIPPSGGLFCYKPGNQFLEGWHTAKVTYVDKIGDNFSYLWRFQVTNN
jgi:hypothetical protein